MRLTEQVRRIIEIRTLEHKHEDYSLDIILGEGISLPGFQVNRVVFRPEVTSGILLAKLVNELSSC